MSRVSKQDARIMDIVSDGQGGRDGDRGAPGPAREAREAGGGADRVPARRGVRRPRRAWSTAATGSPTRGRPSSRWCAARATAATSSRTTSRSCARRRPRSRPGSPASPDPSSAGPIKPGSGGLIWPVNGPITSPFCESRSWESCHPGIDIGVPAGTPIRAAGRGQGRADAVRRRPPAATGTSRASSTAARCRRVTRTSRGSARRWARRVSQGQVIGYVGCTGRCFGDHLHFETRINGAVVNPMNYL